MHNDPFQNKVQKYDQLNELQVSKVHVMQNGYFHSIILLWLLFDPVVTVYI